MATIGSLVIDLKMELATFNTNIAKATRDINTFSANAERRLITVAKTVESGFSRLNRTLGAFGIALGGAAIVNFGLNMLRAGGGLKELAEQLGVGTTLLQALQYGAVQAGVSTEELEAGLRKLTQTVGDAAEGSKTAIEAFDKLGVKLLDANGALRPTDDVLRDVAEGLKGIEDPARRASIAVDLMGRGGQRLLPLLSGGAAGIDEITAAAERVGIVLSSEMIDKMDKAADSIDAHILLAKKWAQVWIADVLPVIDQLIQRYNANPGLFGLNVGARILNFATPGQGSLQTGLTPPVPIVMTNSPAGQLIKQQQEAEEAVRAAQNAFLRAQSDFEKGSQLPNATAGSISVLAAAAQEAKERLDEARDAYLALMATVTLTSPAGVAPSLHPGQSLTAIPTVGVGQPTAKATGVDTAANRIQGVIDALKLKTANLNRSNREQEIYNALAQAQVGIDSKSGQIIAGLAGDYYKLAQAKEAAVAMAAIHADQAAQEDQDRLSAIDRGRALNDQRIQAIGNIEREMQMRERLINAIGEGNRAYEVEQKFQEIINSNRLIAVDTAQRLAETYVAQSERLDKITASTQYLADFGDQAFDRIGSSITQAFADGSTAAIDFGGIVKGVISEIIQMLLELTLINPLKNALFGSSLPDFASVFGGGGGLTDPLPGGMQFHFAKGGYLPPGKWGMAGEEGAEAIYGGRAGMTVVPHGEGRGGAHSIVMNIGQGVTPEQMQMAINKVRSEIPSVSLKTVVNDRQRWGTSRKAFRG